MDGFTIVDAVVAGVILISAILAFARGFVRETLSIAGWVAAAVVAFLFAPRAEPLMREIPIVGDFLADSCELSLITAFAVVFAGALLVVSIFTPVFANLVQRSALSSVDQALGFVFGTLRGILLVAVALVVYERINLGQGGFSAVDQSRTVVIFEAAAAAVEQAIPDEAPQWIVQRYEELTAVCTAPGR